mmetsp:Transcript_38172/g.76371  ORF Transcript_38172/g.76371 Transcript_38172/m.76371 type:complete len:209 (-) Transcript_38172:764-1390(-)
MASSMFCVKTEACSPSGESLASLTASSVVLTEVMGRTGPNCSSYISFMSAVMPERTVGYSRLPSCLNCPSAGRSIFAPLSVASVTRLLMRAALFLSITGVTSASSYGDPTLSFWTPSRTIGRRTDETSSCSSTMYSIFTAVHRCPLYENAPFTIALAAALRLASLVTMQGSLPPSSIWMGIMETPFATWRPVDPPVKVTALAILCWVM